MSSRHRAREFVLKALYAWEQGEQSPDKIIESVISSRTLDENDYKFACDLLKKTVDNIKTIDRSISRLATNWTIERLAVVDKNIMRIAICEIELMPDIPIKVAINEAIELAKRYSTYESAAFVNGILDKVMKERGEEPLISDAGLSAEKKPEGQ